MVVSELRGSVFSYVSLWVATCFVELCSKMAFGCRMRTTVTLILDTDNKQDDHMVIKVIWSGNVIRTVWGCESLTPEHALYQVIIGKVLFFFSNSSYVAT